MHRALKNQIERAVEPQYLAAIRNDLSGFNAVTALDMVNYLYQTYGEPDLPQPLFLYLIC